MEKLDRKIFAERFKEEIKTKFNSIKSFAKIVDHKNISNFTSGNREPGALLLNKFARNGIDINYLITGEKNMDKEFVCKLEKLENDFKELKAEIYDLRKENKELKNDKDKLIFEVTALDKNLSKKLNTS